MNTVLNLITGLNTGGAEMMLYKIIHQDQDYRHVVIALNGATTTPIGRRLQASNVEVHSLNLKSSRLKIPALMTLFKLLGKYRPTTVHCWMYHTALVSVLAKPFMRHAQLVWNIRHSIHDIKLETLPLRIVISLCAWMSWLPSRIIYNSSISKRQHEALGFNSGKAVVIYNGFDLQALQSNPASKVSLRHNYDIRESMFVIGVIARYHPMKGHRHFLEALAELKQRRLTQGQKPGFVAVLIGAGLDADNTELVGLINQLQLQSEVRLLGEQPDIPQLINLLDCLVSSSLWGEGFSNVIGEAMACKLPCIVSNVGDSPFIVGDTGMVYEPGDTNALVSALDAVMSTPEPIRHQQGDRALARIERNFSLDRIVEQYKTLYR